MIKKRNPQDLTLRNLRALRKELSLLKENFKILRILVLEHETKLSRK